MRVKAPSKVEEGPHAKIEDALGVKGQLRVRPYGNVKHAHVVMRMVEEEEYVDDHGKTQKRAIFSLFAHKLINVKPGKELFLYFHPANGDLQERVVALEGDIATPPVSELERVGSMKSEATLVQPEQLLPPRMRKHWAKRPTSSLIQSVPSHPDPSIPQSSNSIHQPADMPSPHPKVKRCDSMDSTLIRAETRLRSSWTPVAVQTDPIRDLLIPSSSSATLESSTMPKRSGRSSSRGRLPRPAKVDAFTQTHTEPIVPPIRLDIASQTTSISERKQTPDKVLLTSNAPKVESPTSKRPESTASSAASSASPSHQRSLSPMEIDSNPTSPDYSPEQFCVDLTNDDDIVEEIVLPKSIQQPKIDTSRLSSIVTLVNQLASAGKPTSQSSASNAEPLPVSVKDSPNESTSVASSATTKHDGGTGGEQIWPTQVNGAPVPFYSSFPAPPQTTLPLTYNQVVPDASHELAPFNYSSVNQPGAAATVAINPSSQSSKTHGKPNLSRSTYKAPTFVPATSLSQPYDPSTSLGLRRPDLAADHNGNDAYSDSKFVKNELKRSYPSYDAPERTERALAPSKKWKSIVKAEPMSPVLSFSQPIEPVPDNLGDIFPPPIPATRPNGQPITSAPVLRATDWPESLQIKTEALDASMHGAIRQNNYNSSSWNHPSDAYNNPYAEYPQVIDLTTPTSTYGTPGAMQRRGRGGKQNHVQTLFARYSAHVKMKNNARDQGVRDIVYDDQGLYFAIVCRDSTVRVWDSVYRLEIAKLSHSSNVVAAFWLEAGRTLVSLGANGVISKWTMADGNRWDWDKLIDTGENEPGAMAFSNGRIAVAHPRKGIRIWEYDKETGIWEQLDRDVPRKAVAAIKFIADGSEILCGSYDGSVFRITVPKCRVLPVTTVSSKCFSVDADEDGKYALIAEAYGRATLLDIEPSERTDGANTETCFPIRDAENMYNARALHAFGAHFVGRHQEYVIFGAVSGRALVWDRKKGTIQFEMDHGPGVLVQAIAYYESTKNEAQLLTCTRKGKLTWWDLPEVTTADHEPSAWMSRYTA